MNAPAKKTIRVMVIEDHILIRLGLRTISEMAADIELVAHAEDGETAAGCFQKYRPDVLLVDMRLPRMDGVETITRLRGEFGDVRALMLSAYGAEEDIHRAIQAGAVGYLLKDMPLSTVVEAIRAAAAGQQYLPPEILSRLATRSGHSPLTDRELAVLNMLAAGKSNKEIGAALGIVEGTAKIHVANIFAKLQVPDRTQAVTTAIKRGIIKLD